MPALSTNTNRTPYHSASVDTLSRVVPGVSETIAIRLPARRLNRVDLPTFGRPTMAIIGKAMAENGQLNGQLMLWHTSGTNRDSLHESHLCPHPVLGLLIHDRGRMLKHIVRYLFARVRRHIMHEPRLR